MVTSAKYLHVVTSYGETTYTIVGSPKQEPEYYDLKETSYDGFEGYPLRWNIHEQCIEVNKPGFGWDYYINPDEIFDAQISGNH